MGLVTTPIKVVLGVAVIGVAAAFVLPMYAAKHAEDKAAAEEANPFAASAVAAASPAIDTTKQVALATPQGQLVAAIAPVAVPVAAAAIDTVITPRAIYKPKPKPEPKFETVTRHVCENKTVTVDIDVPDPVKPVERNVAGMLLGGAAGALLGNQVGGGTGRTLATLAGAAGGAYAGDRMANSEQAKLGTHKEQRSQVVEVCHNVTEQVRVN